jgi:hypothetical protein
VRTASFDTIRAIALDEMVGHVAGTRGALAQSAARRLLGGAASSLARQLVALDQELATGALRPSALSMLRRYGVPVRVEGSDLRLGPVERVPALFGLTGPLLVIANHPGLFDALALFAAIGREDLAVLAAERPLLHALPHVRARLLSIEPGARGGFALRRALRHLQRGGALLHFPAGQIEPDPRVTPLGRPLLLDWKPGLDALLAAAVQTRPDLQVAPALVSGVLSRRALAVAQTLRPSGELTGALVPLLQLTLPGFGDVDVRVSGGQPASMAELLPNAGERLRDRLLAIAERVRTSFRPGKTLRFRQP